MKKVIFILLTLLIISLGVIYYLSLTNAICWEILGCKIPVRKEETVDTKGKIVFLISFDGLRGDLVTANNMPFLYSMLDRSKYTLSAQTISDSETLPAHTSMLTGLLQDKHKVDWNTMDLTKPYLKVKTLFDYLEEDGVNTLLIVSKNKLLYFNKNEMDEDNYFYDEFAEQFTDKSLNVIPKKNGHDIFVFLHYKDVDARGHEFGWGSAKQAEAIQSVDSGFEKLYEEVRKRFSNDKLTFIISADHGGLGKGHHEGRPEDFRIPFVEISDEAPERIEKRVNIYDATCEVLQIFEIEKAGLDCSPI